MTLINHILLNGIATYTQPVDIYLKDINFFYGGNGTGKTTISNLISGDLVCSTCIIDKTNEENETTLVYNKSFVVKNFREVGDISGIFTLGQDAGETQESIQKEEADYHKTTEQINAKEQTIKKLSKELEDIEHYFNENCWEIQLKYRALFSKAMIGTGKSKSAFSQKCIDIYHAMGESIPKKLDELESLYHAAYSKEATIYNEFSLLNLEKATKLDTNDLLAKRITGKADSDIGRFIEFLGASDWVKRGTILAKKADGKCPYCAQYLPEKIRYDIEQFFDETYQIECDALKRYAAAYRQYCDDTLKQLDAIIKSEYSILSYEQIIAKVDNYKALVEKNKALLSGKIDAPSTSVEIDSCIDLVADINSLIKVFNKKIIENNDLVKHQKESHKKCHDEVWIFLVSELLSIIKEYKRQSEGKKNAIKNIKEQQEDLRKKAAETKLRINEKRATISSVQHTIEAINTILIGYGFKGFRLAENEQSKGTYKIIRPDGTDAKATLSEGEYNFITFLYFYHLIFGSKNKEDVSKDKIIVIDDPISSLDSNVLFIVSSLVKNIITLCRNGEHFVKQVLISTHNIYFHKEITFVGSRDHWPTARTAFFIVRKKNEISSITEYKENQIQSSYEMLWDDIRQPMNGTAKSIFNTMRRILENYFNIIGGIDYEACVNEFICEDKLICKSLISCINEQSHTISDDYFMCIEDGEIEQYLRVFREIFVKMNHLSHYNMMMRIDSEKENSKNL